MTWHRRHDDPPPAPGEPIREPKPPAAPVVERWIPVPGRPDYLRSTTTGAIKRHGVYMKGHPWAS